MAKVTRDPAESLPLESGALVSAETLVRDWYRAKNRIRTHVTEESLWRALAALHLAERALEQWAIRDEMAGRGVALRAMPGYPAVPADPVKAAAHAAGEGEG